MKAESKQIKEYLAHFHIAGFTYYDGAEAYPELAIGKELEMQLEPENTHDGQAVIIKYKNWKLGYIPRTQNSIFHKLLKIGVTNIQLRVQRLDASEHPEAQVHVVAHLVGEETKEADEV